MKGPLQSTIAESGGDVRAGEKSTHSHIASTSPVLSGDSVRGLSPLKQLQRLELGLRKQDKVQPKVSY